MQVVSEFCNLHLIQDKHKHIDTVMPVLILILEKATNPIRLVIKYTFSCTSTFSGKNCCSQFYNNMSMFCRRLMTEEHSLELIHLACELLSISAVQFKGQFAPWASTVIFSFYLHLFYYICK